MQTCDHQVPEFPAFIKHDSKHCLSVVSSTLCEDEFSIQNHCLPPNYYTWQINMQTIRCWSSLRVPSSRTQTPMPSFVRHVPNSPAAITGRCWIRMCRSFQKTAGKCYCCVSATHRGCDISIMFGAFCCVQVLSSVCNPRVKCTLLH